MWQMPGKSRADMSHARSSQFSPSFWLSQTCRKSQREDRGGCRRGRAVGGTGNYWDFSCQFWKFHWVVVETASPRAKASPLEQGRFLRLPWNAANRFSTSISPTPPLGVPEQLGSVNQVRFIDWTHRLPSGTELSSSCNDSQPPSTWPSQLEQLRHCMQAVTHCHVPWGVLGRNLYSSKYFYII